MVDYLSDINLHEAFAMCHRVRNQCRSLSMRNERYLTSVHGHVTKLIGGSYLSACAPAAWLPYLPERNDRYVSHECLLKWRMSLYRPVTVSY